VRLLKQKMAVLVPDLQQVVAVEHYLQLSVCHLQQHWTVLVEFVRAGSVSESVQLVQRN
jgi:hypothetical protein